MTYFLSNIAKSCISTKNRPNILYIPSISVIDSIVSSLTDINLLNMEDYWINNIDAMIYNPKHTSIDEKDLLWKYHFKIIKITTEDKQEKQEDNNIYWLDININQILIEQQYTDNKKLLLYILDNDHLKATMTLEYLNSLQIDFTVFKPNEFIDINLVELNKIISQFKFVLNNTSIENLILVDKIGSVPLTFMQEFAQQNSSIQLVDQNNFQDKLSNIFSEKSNKIIDNTEQMLGYLNRNILDTIYKIPFIL